MELTEALALVGRLARTKDYPADIAGVTFLAEGLLRAADQYSVDPHHVVMTCATTSRFCPTDADLVTIARQIHDEQKRAQEALEPSVAEQWQRKYGPAKPFDWTALDREKTNRIKSRERELWAALKHRFHGRDLGQIDWITLAGAAEELGYADYAKAWKKSVNA